MNFKISILFLLTIILSACGKSTQECAKESLVGDWKVTTVSETRTILLNGIASQLSQEEFQPQDGFFTFTVDMMQYEYTTTALKTSDQTYNLKLTKENSGFTNVDVFTIIGDVEEFKVRFGDQTSDAHEDATEISLEQTISSDTLIINRFIELVID